MDVIRAKTNEILRQIEAAEKDSTAAAERMDLEAFEAAEERKKKAQNAAEMYRRRYDQIKHREYISEEESDATIDSLLAYEAELAEEFKQSIAKIYKRLEGILDEYTANVADVETTFLEWTSEIHSNFRSFSGTMRTDPLTGARTNRMEKALPVHAHPYVGGDEAARLADFLRHELWYKDE